MAIQDKRIGDILDRMDKRIARLEERQFGTDPSVSYTGAELYKMVQERKQEITEKFAPVADVKFYKTTPIIAATFAALDAMSGSFDFPAIGY